MILKRAMIITISSKEWDMSKSILMEYKGNSDRLDEMAKELFEDYKKNLNCEVILLNYIYYGTIEVMADASQRQMQVKDRHTTCLGYVSEEGIKNPQFD